MSQISEEQRGEILDRYIAAVDAGDEETAEKILKQLPLPAWLAEAGKSVYGKEYMKASGFDLSEAEAEYGPDWLEK